MGVALTGGETPGYPSFAMRSFLSLAFVPLLFATFAAGCGSSAPPPMPNAVVGNYAVVIDANGKMDMDQMTMSVGSNQNVLLDFVYGISQVRGTLAGATQLTLPRQTLHVAHSTGVADGVATGEGTIAADGSIDITLHLTTAGFGPSDGGSGAGASGPVDYHITGMKN